ncbi:MAG: hypothetical protein AAF065_08890 [Verrucomicrobiota bacterium]
MQKQFVYGIFLCALMIGLSGCRSVSPSASDEVFEIVAVRKPGDVAMPAGSPRAPGPGKGDQLVVSEQLQWIDGKVYADWIEVPLQASALSMGDPIFADVYFGLQAAADVRFASRYVSDGVTVGEIYWVDTRVGLIPRSSGSPVYILEKVISRDAGRLFEAALKAKGFPPGLVDGVIDQETRAALGLYLESEGLPYRYAVPVVTDAVYEAVVGSSSE